MYIARCPSSVQAIGQCIPCSRVGCSAHARLGIVINWIDILLILGCDTRNLECDIDDCTTVADEVGIRTCRVYAVPLDCIAHAVGRTHLKPLGHTERTRCKDIAAGLIETGTVPTVVAITVVAIKRPAHQFVSFALYVRTLARQIHIELSVVVPVYKDIAVHPCTVDGYKWSDCLAALNLKYSRCLVEICSTAWCSCNIVEHLLVTTHICNTNRLGIVRCVRYIHIGTMLHIVVALRTRTHADEHGRQSRKKD